MRVDFEHKSGRKQRMQIRYAKVLSKLGRGTYMTRDMHAERSEGVLAELRSQYQDVVGKRPYHGWDADELRHRIEEAESE